MLTGSRFKGLPWCRFNEFINLNADRYTILKELLIEAGLSHSISEIAGNRHFIIRPAARAPQKNKERIIERNLEREEQKPAKPPNVLVAHYDRREKSPGANDNSAAVFILIEAAIKLSLSPKTNWLVIFTDKEELSFGESIENQGAYSLARELKTAPLKNARIYCFDACGTGDTLLVSTTLEYLLAREKDSQLRLKQREKMRLSLAALRGRALDAAREINITKAFALPTPFSDDAGFFRAALAAQTITMLPWREYSRFAAALQRSPDLADALVNADALINTDALRRGDSDAIPETWRLLNTPADVSSRLTGEHYTKIVRLALALCRG